jgi:hypothetical protein
MKIIITIALLALLTISVAAKNCRGTPPPCIIDGCFMQLCDEGPRVPRICPMIAIEGGINTCYQDATCARQKDGQCGWTMTPKLQAIMLSIFCTYPYN